MGSCNSSDPYEFRDKSRSPSQQHSAALPVSPIETALLLPSQTELMDRLIQRVCRCIEVACLEATLNSFQVDLTQMLTLCQFDRERLRAAHAAKACGDCDRAGERVIKYFFAAPRKVSYVPAVSLACRCRSRNRRHLAVHH